MPIKTPKFWYRAANTPAPLIETILTPFEWIYGAGHRFNLSRSIPVRAHIPIICIGNIVAGGSGKTPTLLALLKLIQTHKISAMPYCLSRGYGGYEPGPHLVDPQNDTVQRVGDEPLLLAKYCKTIICANRPLGAAMAQENGADILLMDDGYQNLSLIKDISFLVVDGETGFGNNHLLPRGPLREPIEDGLRKASAVIIIGNDATNIKTRIPEHTPLFHAKISAKMVPDKAVNYVAFCGLGRPEKFKKSLTDLGINICAFYDYPDHYVYSDQQIKALRTEALQFSAKLITTEKDLMRITPSLRVDIEILPIEIEFDQPAALATFIQTKLAEKIT